MLSMLVNKRFNTISRANDMLCLFLGEDYSFFSRSKRIDVAELSLHIQSQWRFRSSETILLASRDIYEPYSKNVPEDWEYDLVGRPDELSSVFDVYVKKFKNMMRNTYVVDCRLSETNDITIIFSNGVIFEQFTPATIKGEEWRLIDYINDVHIVCYDESGKISQN